MFDFLKGVRYNGAMHNERVFIEERLEQIVNLVNERRRITVKELCAHFGVSLVTVRNDLNELGRQGKIIRTHGGAIAAEDAQPILPFNTRRKTNYEQKHTIAQAAAGLVSDGEVIFIDAGTTAVEIPVYLKEKSDLTVITPSIEVAHWLLTHTSFNVYMLNGFLHRKSFGTTGAPCEDFMSEWNMAKAFCGAAGFTVAEGLTDRHIGFVEQKRVIVKKAQTVVGLVDSTKLGIVSLGSFAAVENIDVIITDRGISEEMEGSLQERGIEVIVT
jgi:DeoR/GlpR family transcriptional regulator of sugar metabolism